jgi:hypothetical protein
VHARKDDFAILYQKLEQVPGEKVGDTVDVYAPDHLPLLKVRLISAKVCRHPGSATRPLSISCSFLNSC